MTSVASPRGAAPFLGLGGRARPPAVITANLSVSGGDAGSHACRSAPTPASALNASVESLRLAGVKAVCWDFDKTILKIHSYSERIDAAAVPHRNVPDDFCDLPFFVMLVHKLVASKFHLAIASFGVYGTIQSYMDVAFGLAGQTPRRVAMNRIFSVDNIVTPVALGEKDGCVMAAGKNRALEMLTAKLGIKPEELLFFDGGWWQAASRVGGGGGPGDSLSVVVLLARCLCRPSPSRTAPSYPPPR